MCHKIKKKELYKNLYNLVKDKNYFVVTTNTDGQFINNGFDKEKVFEVQGSYSKLQSSIPGHNKLYDNEELVKEMISNIDEDLKIPTSLVPKCPVCGENMAVNLRCDDTFVEDDNWNKMQDRYDDFIKKNLKKKVLLLEFGIGFNTPGIIRFPFERMTYMYDNFKLIRFNNKFANVSDEIKDRAISVTDSISSTIDLIEKMRV